jgi:hypothetical protein
MIKHIVLWKLDDSYSTPEKDAIKIALRKKLFDLKEEIRELQHIEVYLNSPEASMHNFEVMLETIFSSLEELAVYQAHPSHIKVAEYIASLKLQRAAIDFSF